MCIIERSEMEDDNKPKKKRYPISRRKQSKDRNPLKEYTGNGSKTPDLVCVPEDQPLTVLDWKFINELKITPENICAAYMRSRKMEGVANSRRRAEAHDLLRKPNVAKVVRREIGEELLKLGINSTAVLKRAALIAMADMNEIVKYEDGRVKIVDNRELNPAGAALIDEISETVNADGGVTVKVKAQNRFQYFQTLCKYFAVLEKANLARVEPHREQVDMLEAVMAGTKTPVEACLFLESKGVPIPETLRILLSKPQPEVDPMDDVTMPTAEEMWERRKARMKEIETQREGLDQVRAEVAEIKKELGDKVEQFKPEDVIGDWKKDMG